MERLRRLSPLKKVAVLAIAGILIGASLILFVIPELRPLPLSSGSTLSYTLSGSVNNTTVNAPISGTYNFTIGEYTEAEHSYGAEGEAYTQGLDLQFPVPFYWNGNPEGMLIGYDRVLTSLGEKSVETWLEPLHDHLIIREVGMESSILYRIWIVSPEYHYSFSLVKANQTHLEDYDKSLQLPVVHSLVHPADQPTCHLAQYGDTWGRSSTYGSLEISHGERARYNLTGNATTCLFFDISDIDRIKDTGLFQYNASLSRLAGDPGETDVQAQPGTYWYFVTMSKRGFAWMYWPE